MKCDIARMKTSASKSKVLHLSRNPVQCSLQVGGVFTEAGGQDQVSFTSDGRQDEELHVRSGKATTVIRAFEKGKTLGN